MKRLFGVKKETPAPSLTEAVGNISDRAETIDVKIKKLDGELLKYKEQMKKMRPGPAQNAVKQRALRTLKQKKMYEQQRDQMTSQAFNLEQTSFATETLKDTAVTVQAMKGANVALKQQFKEISVTDVENVQDDLADMLEDASEIQEILAQSYAMPDDIDEADLEAELADLEEEMLMDGESEEPSYLAEAGEAPAVPTAVPLDGGSVAAAVPIGESVVGEPANVDEFGLPVKAKEGPM